MPLRTSSETFQNRTFKKHLQMTDFNVLSKLLNFDQILTSVLIKKNSHASKHSRVRSQQNKH